MTFSTYALADLLDAFASTDPAPGGGSASALTGAVAVALLIMVAGVPRTRRGTAEDTTDLAEASARLRPLRETLAQLVDRDSDAYRAVIAAFKLPKTTDAERAARRDAVAVAMHNATETPLAVMRACREAVEIAAIVADKGVVTAASDVGVAIELLLAAARGAGLSVDANLGSIADAAFAAHARSERENLEADTVADAARARRLLPGPRR
jgi:methenyltetrahydrofolate cyclohydrolase